MLENHVDYGGSSSSTDLFRDPRTSIRILGAQWEVFWRSVELHGGLFSRSLEVRNLQAARFWRLAERNQEQFWYFWAGFGGFGRFWEVRGVYGEYLGVSKGSTEYDFECQWIMFLGFLGP